MELVTVAGFADGTVPSQGAEAAETRVIMCEFWPASARGVPVVGSSRCDGPIEAGSFAYLADDPGRPMLRRHVLAAVAVEIPQGTHFAKPARGSQYKVDALAALLNARIGRNLYLSQEQPMTEPTEESFTRPEPTTRYACGALVKGRVPGVRGAYTYRCRIVPNGKDGIGCGKDHTRVILAERRLTEAIDNAHRSSLSAEKGWEPAEIEPSVVDSHYSYIGTDAAHPAMRARDFGPLRPEHEELEAQRRAHCSYITTPEGLRQMTARRR